MRATATFIIPNPWDVGTARLLAHLGFKALATTVRRLCVLRRGARYRVGREEMIVHVGDISSATDLPVGARLRERLR